jgi:hypothetical protein
LVQHILAAVAAVDGIVLEEVVVQVVAVMVALTEIMELLEPLIQEAAVAAVEIII